jgi:hypothetical protein
VASNTPAATCAKKKGDVADNATRAYNALRRGDLSAYDTVTAIDGYYKNKKGPVLMINEALNDLGQKEKDKEAAYARAAGGNTITHKKLPAFDTPRGFMSPQAWDAVRDGDAAAVALIFEGNTQGERSAPKGGFTHVHVDGFGSRVMSYHLDPEKGKKRIIAFTGHMDNTAPGRAEAARATAAAEEAERDGWVWVAIINNGFYRITEV